MGFILALSLAGCGDDNNTPDYPIQGSWEMTEISQDGGQTWKAWPFGSTVVAFLPGGTYSSQGYFGYENGRWTLTGNKVECISPEGTPLPVFSLRKVEETRCEMNVITLYGSLYVRARRVG